MTAHRGWDFAWPPSRRSSRGARSNPAQPGTVAGASGCWCRSAPARTMRVRPDGRRMRVLVVDDHDVVHWGFRVLLGEQPWVERCLAARTGAEALELTRTFEPQVALVDLFLAGESGADVCESIREVSPATKVLLISSSGRVSPAAP